MSKRTLETQKKFDEAKRDGTSIVEVGENGETYFNLNRTDFIREFTYWVIIKNDFPYDSILEKHDMLVPKRPFNYIREALLEELFEYYEIKKLINTEDLYDSIIENFMQSRSAKGHFHAHLVVWKN